MFDVERRKIISDLNAMFRDFDYLSELATFCDNDVDKIIKMISKIIKYSFCHGSSRYFGYLVKTDLIDSEYNNYLNENKKRFSIFKKQVNISFPYEVDSDIRVSDLEGLILPLKGALISACTLNIQNMEEEKRKRSESSLKYKEAIKFEESVFWYPTIDLVKFDSNFIYFHGDLIGDLNTDFYNLYHDERYINSHTNPLKLSFTENLNNIIRSNDIDITRIGNLHVINNGRHRILYLMHNDCDTRVPVYIKKRIEDREFNIILIRIKNKYNVSILKNNILNEDSNILINYNKKTYNIKNKEELIKFEEMLDNNLELDEYFVADYIYYNRRDDNKDSLAYIIDKMLIFWINNQELDIFNGNYTDYLKVSGETNSNLLYEAFTFNQRVYNKNKLSGVDFLNSLLKRINDPESDNDVKFKIMYEESGCLDEKKVKI